MNTHLKIIKRLIVCTMTIMMLTVICASCGDAAAPARTNETPPGESTATDATVTVTPTTPTQAQLAEESYNSNKLVLYADPYLNSLYRDAVALYQSLYPDVEVECQYFSNNMEGQPSVEEWLIYKDKMITELNLGRGADVIIADNGTFEDVFKLMRNGRFFDINLLLERDDDFDLSPFTYDVMQAGVLDGKRFMIPISYTMNMMLTTEEALMDAEIPLPETWDLDTLAAQIEQYERYYAADPSKTAIYEGGSIKDFIIAVNFILEYAGLQPLNYTTGEIDVDSDAFQQTMQECKRIFDALRAKVDGNHERYSYGQAILDGNRLYEFYFTPGSLSYAMNVLQESMTPVVYPMPSAEGKHIFEPHLFAQINSNSPNKQNAYNFIKVLLSEQIQGGDHPIIPVRSDIIRDKILAYTGNLEDAEKLERIGANKSRNVQLPMETAERLIELYTENLISNRMSSDVRNILYDKMLPYFKGAASYEDCLNDMKNQLRFYRDE